MRMSLKRLVNLMSSLLGLGFSLFILYHLLVIREHGSVTIYEPNKRILDVEIATLSLLILLIMAALVSSRNRP